MAKKEEKSPEATDEVVEIEYELDAEGNQILDAEGNPIPKKKKSKKKLIIIILVSLVLLGGGAAAFFLLGGENTEEGAKTENAEGAVDENGVAIPMPEPVYMDLPDIVVNLNSTSRRTNYINLKITLELSKKEDIAAIESQMPRIIDAFNTYLRELRREDLQGSAGVYRLENELMLRLQKTLVKGEVKDILFREIIIQ
jgi:flagellar FliL protein